MPVPTNLTDLSTTASSNSPASSESPVDGDNYLRAHAAFVAQLNANKIDKTGTVAYTANQPMGGYKHTGAAAASASGQYLLYGQASAVLGGQTNINATGTDPGLIVSQIDESGTVPALYTKNATAGGATQFVVSHSAADVLIGNVRTGSLFLATNGANRLGINTVGTVYPITNAAQDLGGIGFEWNGVYGAEGIFSTSVSTPAVTGATAVTLTGGTTQVSVGSSNFYPEAHETTSLGDPVANRWNALYAVSGTFTGAVTAGTFSGAGTSLTGTAAALSIGGNAATATSATTAAACSGNAATATNVAWSGITSVPAAVSSAAAGTYTPTLTAVSNVSASTAYDGMYTRVGDVVTVSGTCLVTPTAAGFTQLDISLPIASNVGGTNSVAGVAASISGTAGTSPARISAAPVQDRAMVYFYDDNGGSRLMSYQFSYVVV